MEPLGVCILTGAVAGLCTVPYSMWHRVKIFEKRADLKTDRVMVLFERFLWFKAILDTILCLILFAGQVLPRREWLCATLGCLYQFEEVATLVLLMRIAYHPYKFMVITADCDRTEQYFSRTVNYSVGAALLVCIPLAATRSFGWQHPLCWLPEFKVQFAAFFSIVLVCWVCVVYSLARVVYVIAHRTRPPAIYDGGLFDRSQGKLMAQFASLAVVVITTYLFRMISWGYKYAGEANDPFIWMAVITIAYRPVNDSLVYIPKDHLVQLFSRLDRRLWPKHVQTAKQDGESTCSGLTPTPSTGSVDEERSVKLSLLGKARPVVGFTTIRHGKMEDRSIYVTTYNMGECTMAALAPLSEWIPRNMDLYVIGVQECICAEALGAAIHTYLGGPERFVRYQKSIGSTQRALGYHGMVSLWVFARRDEVEADRFLIHEAKRQNVARGMNLGLVRAQNKGGVALAFRYHDTTFAFINVHLASDLKGRSRLSKRNTDARRTMTETNLWREDYQVDVYHQHHHVIFLGDMNYRMRGEPVDVLSDVSKLCEKEMAASGYGQQWRHRRYQEVLQDGRQDMPPAIAVKEVGGVVIRMPAEEGEGPSYDDDYDEDQEDRLEWSGVSMLRKTLSGIAPVALGSRTISTLLRRTGSSLEREGRPQDSMLVSQLWPLSAADTSVSVSALSQIPPVNTWADMLRRDELTVEMEAGRCFYGFFEPQIQFPPSYRRTRGPAGDCGPYTDLVLLKQAYSIAVKEKKRRWQRRPSLAKGSNLRQSNASLNTAAQSHLQQYTSRTPTNSNHPAQAAASPHYSDPSHVTIHPSMLAEGVSEYTQVRDMPAMDDLDISEVSSSAPSKRTPSYTDRILVHSLEDKKPQLRVGKYDTCEAFQGSDHRIVSATFCARVDTSVQGLGAFKTSSHLHHQQPSGQDHKPRIEVHTVEDSAFFVLRLSSLSATFDARALRLAYSEEEEEAGEAPLPTPEPAQVRLLFPLENEDCFNPCRRAQTTAEVAHCFCFLTSEFELNPFRLYTSVTWSNARQMGLSCVRAVRPEFGLHATLNLRDANGVGLGQCVLSLVNSDGNPLAAQPRLRLPLTVGGCLTGQLTCDVELEQLVLDAATYRWWQ